MLHKLIALMTAFVWAALEKVGLAEKVERVARGETVYLDAGHTVVPARLPASLAEPAVDRGQLGFQTVIAALVVVIAASLAVIVVDQFDTTLGSPSSSSLSDAQASVISGFGDMASLIGPLLLVGIAVVIISLLRRTQSA